MDAKGEPCGYQKGRIPEHPEKKKGNPAKIHANAMSIRGNPAQVREDPDSSDPMSESAVDVWEDHGIIMGRANQHINKLHHLSKFD